MGDIKSAREIAMEKVARMGEVTEEERLEWKYVPEGEKLAAKYLSDGINLLPELGKYEDKAKELVISGIKDVLIRNIRLPKNEVIRKNNKGAMDGLRTLVQDKVAAENVFSKMRRVFDHYSSQGQQQRQQAYESLKSEFTERLQMALQQKYGTVPAGVRLDVERQPQFQEEWMKLQAHLEAQYLKLLDEYKQELFSLK